MHSFPSRGLTENCRTCPSSTSTCLVDPDIYIEHFTDKVRVSGETAYPQKIVQPFPRSEVFRSSVLNSGLNVFSTLFCPFGASFSLAKRVSGNRLSALMLSTTLEIFISVRPLLKICLLVV